jgi:predicted peptidase
MKVCIAICLLVLSSTALWAQDRSLYEKKEFIQGNDTLRYRVLYPLDYHKGKKYPVVLFLHGSGERGNDNESQLSWGADLFLDSMNRQNYPAIVVFPQCPLSSSWVSHTKTIDSLGFNTMASVQPTTPLLMVMELMREMVQAGEATDKRIYVGGLSMGGFGTYDILWRMPHFFAAAFPICGGGSPDKPAQYAKKFPIWIFHGGADPVVPVANSHLMLQVFKDAGADVKYSEYAGVGHDSWKNAFAEPGLLPWLFDQKR